MSIVKTIDAHTLKAWLDNDEAILIDVREPAEYAAEHIKDSILIPSGTITKQNLPALESKKLVIHCQLGKRGSTACVKLNVEDPTIDVYNLDGGIIAWINAGYKTEKTR
jgi:rhodanese-related sulfurtransferase